MKNKRVYNNLFDSICITILFFIYLAVYLIVLNNGVINHNEQTNSTILFILSTIVFGIGIIFITFYIIKFCYGYWILLDDSIIYKTPFSKKTIIKFIEIEKVEKKIIPAFILGTYKSEAYIIQSNDKKIVILIKEHEKYVELDYALSKFQNKK